MDELDEEFYRHNLEDAEEELVDDIDNYYKLDSRTYKIIIDYPKYKSILISKDDDEVFTYNEFNLIYNMYFEDQLHNIMQVSKLAWLNMVDEDETYIRIVIPTKYFPDNKIIELCTSLCSNLYTKFKFRLERDICNISQTKNQIDISCVQEPKLVITINKQHMIDFNPKHTQNIHVIILICNVTNYEKIKKFNIYLNYNFNEIYTQINVDESVEIEEIYNPCYIKIIYTINIYNIFPDRNNNKFYLGWNKQDDHNMTQIYCENYPI